MLGYNTSRDGLLQLEEDVLASMVQKESILGVYEVDKTPLGRGKYATVCRAVHKKTGTHYAAKFVKKRRRNQDQMKEIIHEIAVLRQCSATSRVIRLHEVYESTTEMVLVLELAAGGELQHILDGGQCLGEIEARKAMKQILEGVAYLHDRNIAHLDLKPQNLLLSVEDCCDDIKLCDFGISKVLQPGVTVREILGTADYVAPEVLSYEPISLSTDIWSVGVLAYVLLSGFSPFGADDKQQTFLNISKCALSFEQEHFDGVSSAAIDFIKSALIVDPRKRPSVHEMLDHPWISLKTNLLPLIKPTDTIPLTPQSTPIIQRKSFSCITTTTTTNDGPLISLKDLQPTLKRNTTLNGHYNHNCTDKLNGHARLYDKPNRCYGADENGSLNSSSCCYTEAQENGKNLRKSSTYTTSGSCLCPQCGTTCRRHVTHAPVSKNAIALDRGILC